MKKKLSYLLILPVFILVFLAAGIALSPQHSFATPITGPLDASDFQNLNNKGASYGPPPPARFFDGPITVGSGVPADLFAGPKKGQTNVNQLLFVLSCDSGSLPSLGTVNFNIGSSVDGPSISFSFTEANFFLTDVAGFPSSIGGIGNGEVNGIKFPSAFHAGALYPFVGGLVDGLIGNVTVMTSVPLRVDIFGVQNGIIINNTPNSGSLGVVPLPTTMLLLGSGLVGLAELRRRFRRS